MRLKPWGKLDPSPPSPVLCCALLCCAPPPPAPRRRSTGRQRTGHTGGCVAGSGGGSGPSRADHVCEANDWFGCSATCSTCLRRVQCAPLWCLRLRPPLPKQAQQGGGRCCCSCLTRCCVSACRRPVATPQARPDARRHGVPPGDARHRGQQHTGMVWRGSTSTRRALGARLLRRAFFSPQRLGVAWVRHSPLLSLRMVNHQGATSSCMPGRMGARVECNSVTRSRRMSSLQGVGAAP